ncbi:MAG: reverse transcriptase family protein [Patescibacteria group bacterium]
MKNPGQGTLWNLEEFSKDKRSRKDRLNEIIEEFLKKQSERKASFTEKHQKILESEERPYAPTIEKDDWDLLPEAMCKYSSIYMFGLKNRDWFEYIAKVIKNQMYPGKKYDWEYGDIEEAREKRAMKDLSKGQLEQYKSAIKMLKADYEREKIPQSVRILEKYERLSWENWGFGDPFEEAEKKWLEVCKEIELMALEKDTTRRLRERYLDLTPRYKTSLCIETAERNEFLFSGAYPEEYEEVFGADGLDSYSIIDSPEEEISETDFETDEEIKKFLLEFTTLKPGLEIEEDRPSDSDLCANGERLWPVLIRYNEFKAILWLSKELKYDFRDLVKIIERIRNGETFYKIIRKTKPDGEIRELREPYEFLKNLQWKINEHILREFPVNGNAFGFSRGNIRKAIKPHLGAKSIFCVDCKSAFPTVNREHIMNTLTEGWGVRYFSSNRKKYHGKFSWYTARIIADLTTYNCSDIQGYDPTYVCRYVLPQGAPTSPKIFDLVCADMDRKLSSLAKNVKGKYTRYADNIFFSFHKERFPTPIKRAILKIIEGKRRPSKPNFSHHKLRIRVLDNNSIRMLGLNIIDRKIHNTRDFKLRVRKAIHHLNWLLDHGMDYEKAWNKLQGLNSFAQKKTWPQKLKEDYKKAKRRIKEIKK